MTVEGCGREVVTASRGSEAVGAAELTVVEGSGEAAQVARRQQEATQQSKQFPLFWVRDPNPKFNHRRTLTCRKVPFWPRGRWMMWSAGTDRFCALSRPGLWLSFLLLGAVTGCHVTLIRCCVMARDLGALLDRCGS